MNIADRPSVAAIAVAVPIAEAPVAIAVDLAVKDVADREATVTVDRVAAAIADRAHPVLRVDRGLRAADHAKTEDLVMNIAIATAAAIVTMDRVIRMLKLPMDLQVELARAKRADLAVIIRVARAVTTAVRVAPAVDLVKRNAKVKAKAGATVVVGEDPIIAKVPTARAAIRVRAHKVDVHIKAARAQLLKWPALNKPVSVKK